ncbi:MAG TPA: symmetrical bis(5'-nucleosyl)-tetraphosphatase [Nitrospira sp.]|nr:symmetrical bis(5'-nucleosyl)-tetraphosphatase [Nitrospira sp.]
MATYAIGDIQGCFKSFRRLLDHIAFDPQADRLWLVGDLVNRGPDSLATLRYIKSLAACTFPVLGNHDLFLLAAAEDIVTLRPKDTIHDILGADDRSELTTWLRQQPMYRREGEFLMVHAGLLPQWTIDEAVKLAKEVEAVLSGPDYKTFLRELFHGPTPQWNAALKGMERLVSIARVFTRLRTTTPAGETSSYSGSPDEAPAGFLPWFRIPNRRSSDATVITGHWAALGLHIEPNILAIDSGCVWGRQLTAVRLEDRKIYQVEYADRRE